MRHSMLFRRNCRTLRGGTCVHIVTVGVVRWWWAWQIGNAPRETKSTKKERPKSFTSTENSAALLLLGYAAQSRHDIVARLEHQGLQYAYTRAHTHVYTHTPAHTPAHPHIVVCCMRCMCASAVCTVSVCCTGVHGRCACAPAVVRHESCLYEYSVKWTCSTRSYTQSSNSVGVLTTVLLVFTVT